MKRINKILPHAMEALNASGLIIGGTSILKEYDGYVASFAPSVITAGLKATLSFYTDNHKERSPKRGDILKVLLTIYQQLDTPIAGNDLLGIALARNRTEGEIRQLKRDLMDCSIALKLCLRNFKQVESVQPEPLTQPAEL